MINKDPSFLPSPNIEDGVALINCPGTDTSILPADCPELGIGESQALKLLSPYVIGKAARLDAAETLAHMDPPTPWISWVVALWNAKLNQNMLHPATAPFGIEAERRVLKWLTPFFGMDGGHMCSGSTLANLTAIWAARDAAKIERVVASQAAHLSVKKSACMLRIPFEEIPATRLGQMDYTKIGDLSNACLILTAGTTATGEIDPLELIGQARWTHVDAAWGGPLKLSPTHRLKIEGIEQADSISISAHKLLMQPKDSALVMFKDVERANAAISFGGGYLVDPNVGVQGSRSASAITLMATLIALGRRGLVERIDRMMSMATELAEYLSEAKTIELLAMPKTGVTVFRSRNHNTNDIQQLFPDNMFSSCIIEKEYWLRSVAANPLADVQQIINSVKTVIDE